MKKRILAMLMCLMLVFSSSNVAFAAENLGNAVAETQVQSVETVTDTKAAELKTVTVHVLNENHDWSRLNVYTWQGSGSSETHPTGSWPGTPMGLNQEHPLWYTVDISVDPTKDLEIKFKETSSNAESGNGKISAADLAAHSEFWIYCNRNKELSPSIDVSGDNRWTGAFDSVIVNGSQVTFRYKSSTQVKLNLDGVGEYPMTPGNDGVCSYTFTSLKPGTYKYKFIVGEAWIADPANGMFTADGYGNSVTIIPGIVVEEGVEATKGDSTALPPTMKRVANDGQEESVAVDYELKNPETGVSLEENVLTLDDSYAKDKVQLTVSNEFGDTATLDVAVIAGAVVESPVVDGNSVTFNYRNATAKEVYLAGSMFNNAKWDESKVMMTKDPATNIWSYTVNNMSAGQHQYRFVVDGQWILDPRNNLTATLKESINSLVVIKGNAKDTNKITVKFHYSGRAENDYKDWNIWAWGETVAAQLDFDVVGNDRVATMELNARENQYLKFKIRKGDWDDQEPFGECTVDLSDVLAGTVHVYVKSIVGDVTRELENALLGVKVKRADYDRENNQVIVQTALPVEGDIDQAFKFVCTSITDKTDFTIKSVGYKFEDGVNKYILKLKEDFSKIEDVIKCYEVEFDKHSYKVYMPNVYADPKFEANYTYTGNDLGATWSKESTTFKVWAPTADDVKLNLYKTGSAPLTEDEKKELKEPLYVTENPFNVVQMKKGDKGVWTAVVEGDLHKTYYTFNVTIGGETKEASDPYAKTTGVNGNRAMVIDLDSTDPEGWENDKGPDEGMNQTDAIIYELHVRDLSIDENSGISDENKGKYLGVVEPRTTNKTGQKTGLDHIIDLGVTHIHFLPIYDYGSIDEADLDTPQFNWGYNPVNYNAPEGSYSKDPYNGEVRVAELKEMIQTLHENNINVVMDVVYNHVYDSGKFTFNQLVPNYFSRTTADGSFSERSGCGNDTASERDMVRKYIVESVVYWAKEYHIDGFRFDLVGLIDVETINAIVTEVRKVNPNAVFYGEGWDMDGTVMNPRQPLAKQGNAYLTPGFAYFSDTIRDNLRGSNNNATDRGFVSGLTGKEELMSKLFKADNGWTNHPTQVINYASCHDNYTVMDKLNSISDSKSDKIKMNNLSAAFYMLAEGVPLIHAGEEMLRTKVDEEGHIVHNSYKSSDYVNSIKWANLSDKDYQKVVDYYAGLVEFRKNHEALRLTNATDVANNVEYFWINNEVILLKINGKSSVAGEVSDGIIVVFNATNSSKSFNLYNVQMGDKAANITQGTWKVCIDGQNAGIEVLKEITDGNVTVDPISALVLVMGKTVDNESVYLNNGYIPTGSDIQKPDVEVTSIKLNKETAELAVGGTVKLTASFNPSNATDKTVTWSSSDENVATVDANGNVTAVAEGEAVITATTANGKTAICTVTVNVPVTGVSLDKTTAELTVNEELTLVATVAPADATIKTVTWTSSNEKVATVDKNGKVTAKAVGKATITVTTANGKIATCVVTVKVPVTSVSLDQTAAELTVGEELTLNATVAPADATIKKVTWTSSDEDVATVDEDGTVKAVAAGTATITVTTKDGNKTAICKITVKAKATEPEKPAVVKVTSVSINNAPAELTVGGTVTLTATVNPSNATEKTVTWLTSDAKVATVEATTGKVTAVAAGTVTITVTTKDGNKTAICKITVKAKATEPEKPTTVDVTSITLDKTTAALKKGETVTLKATVAPANATNKTVAWSSNNTKVATVDNAGKVTAVADGTAVITAKAGNKTATCTITVKTPAPEPEKPTEVPATGVKLNKSKANLAVGKTLTLKATVTPSDASDKKVTWKSSNTKVATVDKNGKVKAKKAGTVTITAATANGKKATCKVTVVKATLNATSLPLQVKKSVTLTATSTLKGDKVKSWKSSNTKVAKVDKKGKVTATSKTGKVTITVTMKSGATATCTVKVQKGAVTTKKLTLNKTKATLKVKQKLTLKVTRNPISATDKITWKSSNPKVATVDKNGKVTAKKAGKVTITAKVGKKSVKCTITVKKK